MLVIFTQSERGVEVLRHGADVPDGRVLCFVVPSRDFHRAELFKQFLTISRPDILLRIAVTDRGPGTTPSRKTDASRRSSGGDVDRRDETRTAGDSGGEVINSGRS